MKNIILSLMILGFTFNSLGQRTEPSIPVGHTGMPLAIAYSPNQKQIATSGADGLIHIWDIKSSKVIETYDFDPSGSQFLEYNVTGKYLLACSYDTAVYIINTENHTLEKKIKTVKSYYRTATFNPAGDEVLFVKTDQILGIYNLAQAKIRKRIVGDRWPVTAIAYSNDGSQIVIGDKQGNVLKFNAETGAFIARLLGHSREMYAFEFSEDDEIMISTSGDNSAIIWNTKTNEIIRKIKKFKGEVYTAEIIPGTDYLLTTLNDNKDKIWNYKTGKLVATIKNQSVSTKVTQLSNNGNLIFCAGGFDDPPTIYNAQTFELIHTLEWPKLSPNCAAFSPDDKYIAIGYYAQNEIHVYSTETGKVVSRLRSKVETVKSASFNKDATEVIASSSGGASIIWDLKYGRPTEFYSNPTDKVYASIYSPDYSRLAISSEDGFSYLYDTAKDSLLTSFQNNLNWDNFARFSYDGKYILSSNDDFVFQCRSSEDFSIINEIKTVKYPDYRLCEGSHKMLLHPGDSRVMLMNYLTGEVLFEPASLSYYPNEIALSSNGNYMAVMYAETWEKSILKIWDLSRKELIDSVNFPDRRTFMQFDLQSEHLLFKSISGKSLIRYNVKTKEQQEIHNENKGFYHGLFHPDGSKLVSFIDDRKIEVKDFKKDETLVNEEKHKNYLTWAEYFSNGELLLTSSTDGSFIIRNGNTGEFMQQYYFFDNDPSNYIVLIEDGYYLASKKAAKEIYYVVDESIYPLEQFDLKYNRPDKVLAALPQYDTVLVQAYHAAYQKRLKKMGFTEDDLEDDLNLPQINIQNYEELPSINDNGSIELQLDLKDSKYKLDRINVWVNDVAIYGANGISLREQNVQKYVTSLKVELAKGKNKVQVSVLNQAGAESYKETFEIVCSAGKDQPDLYLITIGESEFQQKDYNLTYAAKDAKDISDLFSKSLAYNQIFTKTLTNEEVTKANILALKSFLEKADINDQVMIFIAGHGVLDANLDYYFATYDMDFQHPEERGLAYEDLESLLDGIKPLKKTLMIDACHSGEIDKDEVVLAEADLNESDDIQFRAVGNTASPKLGMQNTSELTKSLFTDLRKGTGATVISSAGGMEFAIEGDDWNNGLFTYCFINGIKSNAADLDKNGEIWLSEIQEYVGQQVTELSGGRQQPTSRIENQVIDFRVW